MNQRPLGYEPNELPDCSTPRRHSTKTAEECQGILHGNFLPPRRKSPISFVQKRAGHEGTPCGALVLKMGTFKSVEMTWVLLPEVTAKTPRIAGSIELLRKDDSLNAGSQDRYIEIDEQT